MIELLHELKNTC